MAIKLEYNHKKVSEDIARFLLSFNFTDNASGKADDLQITLEDREQIWANKWIPKKGDIMKATMMVTGFNQPGQTEELFCGVFEVDGLELAVSPSVVTIKGVSAAITSALRGEQKPKSWEHVNLKTIVEDIANKARMNPPEYLADYNPVYQREDQKVSDLAFLQGLCDKAGLALKVTDKKIVIFDKAEFEKKEPVATINRNGGSVMKANFTCKSRDIYESCEVKYRDTKSGRSFSGSYKPPNGPATGQILRINERVESAAAAEALARMRLREKNIQENTVRMTLVGNPALVAGVTINLDGFCSFDGKYYVTTAKHSYTNSGYKTDIDMYKTLSYGTNAVKSTVS